MPSYFNVTLDTLGPQSPSIQIAGGAVYCIQQLVDLTIGTTDETTTGYQMKIWGDVDLENDTNVQGTEEASTWITYAESKQIKVSTGDGQKTIYLKLRDDVFNESEITSDTITLDMTLPVVTVDTTGMATKISKIATKDTATFTFQVNSDFVEYKVKVVTSTGSTHDQGTQLPTTAGSTNMTDEGTWTTMDSITCSIKGADLEAASAGDGEKIIKVFAKDPTGNWST